jgi:hypothetical protein
MIGEWQIEARESRCTGLGTVSANITGRLVLALSQVNDMPKQTVRRPFGVADFDDHFVPDPMDSRQDKRWASWLTLIRLSPATALMGNQVAGHVEDALCSPIRDWLVK